jgi:hypothetical protein
MLVRLLPALVLSLLLVGAAPARAQDPQVDPDSPAGTEYQLPTDSAREAARSGAGSRGSDGGEAPLFGEGVDEQKPPTSSDRKSGSDSDPATTGAIEADPAPGTRATVRAQAPAPDGGGGGALAIGAIAGGVLLIGGLAGLAWRRRTVGR